MFKDYGIKFVLIVHKMESNLSQCPFDFHFDEQRHNKMILEEGKFYVQQIHESLATSKDTWGGHGCYTKEGN